MDDVTPETQTSEPGTTGEAPFEIHRRTVLYALLALACLLVAGGFAVLALERDDAVLWVPVVVLLVAALVVGLGVRDSRTPLFVADDYGVRMRDGQGWVGLLWSEMAEIRVERREGRHDPRVKVVSPDGRQIYTAPVGFTTTVSAAEAEVQLARRRGAAAY